VEAEKLFEAIEQALVPDATATATAEVA
jgi:hypothetical protein